VGRRVPLLQKYVSSFYWAYSTVTTVGYGDVHAQTVLERLFCVVAMVIGGFIFGAFRV
jgi:uncharacterized membrane protein (UPF0182 family)